MKVKFHAYGLQFEAEAEYYPIVPAFISGPPEDCYEQSGGEIEIHSLKCGGHEATFLLESDILSEVLFDEASIAAEEQVQRNRCPHGDTVGDCNACDIASDIAYDTWREGR